MKRHTIHGLHTVTLFIAAVVLAGFFAIAPAGAQEVTWGGTIDGTGSAAFAEHQDETDTVVSLTTLLWLKALFAASDTTRIEFDVRPSYTWTDERPYLVDLDRAIADLHFGGSRSVFRGTVGRFRLADTTRTVLFHTVDGGEFALSVPLMRVRTAAGYTGFILNPVSNVRMSAADAADSGDDDVFWGPRRMIVLGEVSFPDAFVRQTVTVGYIGQWDLRDADEDEAEDTLDSQYIGATIGGPIAPGLFYDVAFYASPSTRNIGSESENDTGILLTGRVRYFRSDWNSSRIALSGGIVSGAGDNEDNFYTISERQAATVSGIPLRNVGYGALSYGVRPFGGASLRSFRDIQTTVTGRSIFRMSTEQPVDSFGANATDDGRYVGTEATLQVGWRILSDLGTSVTGGMFFPGTGSSGAFNDERKPEYLLRVQVSASF